MQLGPGTTSLACARLIVPFAPFIGVIIIYKTKADESRIGKGQLGGCNIISLDVREEHNGHVIDKI